ncbi:tRNA preQ1(34) S-adenosylmethionine ribosyltransferase-isomerase QueA [Mailhella massiliensis]|uniref:S-adenosylmethionine:tRNA ribosyltransferase-isomerase n=1 Tax=Mailhella massiliensis TaxID=1903261 RepID=A0A921DRN9_9BACT|nr:tRNA preQ1(34) S-adenosylmethionine ribosyltransferase-isomerase QueA [Mailhella massiliensis]HJD96197.1 tRNA preQ1(34) S-adenosylmethionine ribosyltransferase-isomerase QueA [Mailhella massiliensis]
MMNESDFQLSSYDYELPEERIAQYPPKERGASRLMVLDRESGRNIHTTFSHLAEFLPEGALLVANNSCVVPARLFGHKPSGGKAELLLLTPPPLLKACSVKEGDWSRAQAEVLLRPSRSIRVGDRLTFDDCIEAQVLEKKDFGRHEVMLFWKNDLVECMKRIGRLPLPPYIKREQSGEDIARYQTVYADREKSGSVAAPTAGLHFTEEMRKILAGQGIGWAEVTLHVGYGTFSPVRESDIREHPMHSEYVEISPESAEAVRRAREEGRPVIAVGTTSCRTLEGCAAQSGGEIPVGGWHGWTNIFIYPGYEFRVVDHLITNFHLPQSSLIMLVAALCGRERILSAYAEAVREEYRFFSYGDAMFIR